MALNFKEAFRVVGKHFGPDNITTPADARDTLRDYHEDKLHYVLPTETQPLLRIYNSLSTLTCRDMGNYHRNDPKRFDRRWGKRLRQQRTGSRWG